MSVGITRIFSEKRAWLVPLAFATSPAGRGLSAAWDVAIFPWSRARLGRERGPRAILAPDGPALPSAQR